MTVTGNPPVNDADFDARIRRIEAAPDAPESWAATVERCTDALVAAWYPGREWVVDRDAREQFRQGAIAVLRAAALRVVTEPADGGAK